MRTLRVKTLITFLLVVTIILSAFFCCSCGNKDKSKQSAKVYDNSKNSQKETGNSKGDVEEVSAVEELQKKHKLYYYSTVLLAVNNSTAKTIGTGSDSDKDSAVAGVYEENGKRFVALLKNTEESGAINLTGNVTFNLCGNILTVKKEIRVVGENAVVNIDGTAKKSKILMSSSDKETAYAIICEPTNTLNISGGIYAAQLSGDNINTISTIYCEKGGTVNLNDCEVVAKSGSAATLATFIVSTEGNGIAKNCKFDADSTNGKVYCVLYGALSRGELQDCEVNSHSQHSTAISMYISKDATTLLNKTKVFADSRSSHGAQSSIGIYNAGIATINDCNVYGNHSGMQTNPGAKTYVEGGRFESPSHGGIYFAHGASGEAYVEGTEIAMCKYKGRYGSIEIGANGGLYIGSNSDEGNYMSIYFNNCKFINPNGPAFVLSSTYGGKYNSVYVSNSTIPYLSEKARIDSATHKLYIGKGCNFTAENTRLPSAVVMTDEVYTRP